MGFTQGKRPSGAKIGKVHKIMSGNTVVFRDATSSLDDLIARAQENPVHLMLADVTIEEPGHPIEGENWRPQLAPYKPWVHDAALDVLCAGKRGRGQPQAQSDRPSESRLLTLAQQRRQRRRASCRPTSCGPWGKRRAGIRKRKRRIRLAKMRTKLKSVKHRKTVKHF